MISRHPGRISCQSLAGGVAHLSSGSRCCWRRQRRSSNSRWWCVMPCRAMAAASSSSWAARRRRCPQQPPSSPSPHRRVVAGGGPDTSAEDAHFRRLLQVSMAGAARLPTAASAVRELRLGSTSEGLPLFQSHSRHHARTSPPRTKPDSWPRRARLARPATATPRGARPRSQKASARCARRSS